MINAPPPDKGAQSFAPTPPGQRARLVIPPRQPLQSKTPRPHKGLILVIVLCALLAVSSGGQHLNGDSLLPASMSWYSMIGSLLMVGASVLLYWRSRYPLPITVILIVLTGLFPTTPLPLLIALPGSVAYTRGFRRWSIIISGFLATTVSFLWDLAGSTSYFVILFTAPDSAPVDPVTLIPIVPVIAALVVAAVTALGITKKLRVERDTAQHETAAVALNVEALYREVELDHHRRALARELHDTLAASLSTLSLHAGALEMTIGEDDPRANTAARAVRESAQHSLDDLRNVVRELRNAELPSQRGTSFNELPALIDKAVQEGTDVRTQLMLTDPDSCDPTTAHAVYRIVQEAISNVRRHAPNATLYLDLRGGPGVGITVQATNWIPAGGSAHTTIGGGNGLTGMAERTELLGGRFQAGPTAQDAFGIAAWLPWLPAQIH